jgi:hypothetical protein
MWLLTQLICDFQMLRLLAGLTRLELAISASTVQRFDPTKLQPQENNPGYGGGSCEIQLPWLFRL